MTTLIVYVLLAINGAGDVMLTERYTATFDTPAKCEAAGRAVAAEVVQPVVFTCLTGI